MRFGLSIHDWRLCRKVAISVGICYLLVCYFAIGVTWQVEAWESSRLDDVLVDFAAFPFGLLWDNVLVAPLLNGALWSFVAAVVCYGWFWRRHDA
jgi:hypothetical protein